MHQCTLIQKHLSTKFRQYQRHPRKEAKLKTALELQHVLDITRDLLKSLQTSSASEDDSEDTLMTTVNNEVSIDESADLTGATSIEERCG